MLQVDDLRALNASGFNSCDGRAFKVIFLSLLRLSGLASMVLFRSMCAIYKLVDHLISCHDMFLSGS